MIKKLLTILVLLTSLYGMEFSELNKTNEVINIEENNSLKVLGYNLFNGNFSKTTQHRYNPNYLISIGDTIKIKMWGAFELDIEVTVDSQGNIFIPKAGTIEVLGIKNNKLSHTIRKSVKKVFKNSVYVYADLSNYQPVSVFVTGSVNSPGLYDGLSSDSVIQFIDKAKGIHAESGSYRNISILRNNKEVKHIDLYMFLLNGSLGLFQFQMGDVIVVDSISKYIEVIGDVKRPYRFELLHESVTVKKILAAVLVNPTTTDFTVTEYTKENVQKISMYSIKDNLNMKINAGESVNFLHDHTPTNIEIQISGEHAGVHNIIVDVGVTLEDIINNINMSKLSQPDAFQLYRKSIAATQKQLLDIQLADLRAKTLTAGSLTTEEATIRKQEAALVINFIDEASKVTFKGQVVINKDTNLSKVLLEDGDEIYIPKKSHMIVVQGEVMLPGAQTFVSNMSFDDYIDSCGGYNYKADTDNLLLIKKNGQVFNYDDGDHTIEPGDHILVLSEVKTNYFQVMKDLTQIIYQIAIGAAVVLRY